MTFLSFAFLNLTLFHFFLFFLLLSFFFLPTFPCSCSPLCSFFSCHILSLLSFSFPFYPCCFHSPLLSCLPLISFIFLPLALFSSPHFFFSLFFLPSPSFRVGPGVSASVHPQCHSGGISSRCDAVPPGSSWSGRTKQHPFYRHNPFCFLLLFLLFFFLLHLL